MQTVRLSASALTFFRRDTAGSALLCSNTGRLFGPGEHIVGPAAGRLAAARRARIE
jgi:hypothetical protein